MKLNEKIVVLRQQRGWSQEELAERMEVSRQSVSKWESGASTPELDRIVRLCELFGLTADELINDGVELGMRETAKADDDAPLLTLNEAYAYLSVRQVAVQKLALGVAACVASPVPTVLLCMYGWLEGLGIVLMLAMVAWAVWQFITFGSMLRAYRHIEQGWFAPTAETLAWAKSAQEQFRPRLMREIAGGVALCILSPAPFIVFDEIASYSSVLEGGCTAFLLLAVALGCYLFVHSGSMQGVYAKLSRER